MFSKLKSALKRLSELLYSEPYNKQYIPEVLEAAELEECSPENLMYCEKCHSWHKRAY